MRFFGRKDSTEWVLVFSFYDGSEREAYATDVGEAGKARLESLRDRSQSELSDSHKSIGRYEVVEAKYVN